MGCVCLKGCCDGETYELASRNVYGQEGEWRVRGQHVLRTFAQVLEMVSVLGGEDEDRNEGSNDEKTDDIEQENGAQLTSIDNSTSSNDASSIESDDPFNWLWNPICEHPVHINVACIQEGEIYEYTIYAEEKELCPFSSSITVPGTDIKKTGPYFVQWKDVYSGKVYGLNFFSDTEALRFLSSCFPPSYTPDTATHRTTSRPSYVCPSPPPPITHQAKVEDIDEDSDEQNYNPRYGFDYFSSTPIPQPEYFKPPSVNMNQLSTTANGKSDLHQAAVQSIESSPSTLPLAVSATSDISISDVSLPSPPSQYVLADDHSQKSSNYNTATENNIETVAYSKEGASDDDDDDDDNSDDDPELFQPSGPPRINKILEDIPEEDEDVQSVATALNDSISSENVSQTVRTIQDASEKPSLAEFDELLNDLRKSQLLELTEREARLSRQSSFTGGPPPLLPHTPPPGPTLSPQQSTAESVCLTEGFRNALKRLSAIDNDDFEVLPPPLARHDSDEFEFRRAPSFIRYPQPPDAFSSDSGVQSDAEPAHHTFQKDKILNFPAIREEIKTSSSVPSETTESVEAHKFPSSSLIQGEETQIEFSGSNSIKKTGWLEVKGLLMRKNRKVAMKANRRWKRHWAVLRGKNLLLHRLDQHPNSPINESAVDMKIDISHSLAHSVHDHIKREHLFCLSTCSGNTYYMQASNQAAVDDWIRSIHSAAAISVTGQTSKEGALQILNGIISENKEALEKEKQMKNLAELQLTTVSDSVSKSNITKQIIDFSQNIEKCQVNIYRNRCYLASLEHLELPNPQQLLTSVSKPTKTMLSKLGNFSVASLHAVVCVRCSIATLSDVNPESSSVAVNSTGSNTKKRFRFFHKADSDDKKKNKVQRRLFGKSSISNPLPSNEGQGPNLLTYRQLLEPNPLDTGFGATLRVQVPDGKICGVPFRLDLTVEDVIFTCCKKFGLDPADHFLKLTNLSNEKQEHLMPHEDEFVVNLVFTNIEICQKFIRSVQFDCNPDGIGLSVRPDLRNFGSVTHVIIDSVASNSESQKLGLKEGDEIVLINDSPVTHMSWSEVTNSLTKPKFTLTVRTRHYQAPIGVAGRTTLLHLQDLVCPSPPVQGKKMSIRRLIVPKPITEDFPESSDSPTESEPDVNLAEDRVLQLIQGSLEVTGLVDRWKAFEADANVTGVDDETIKQMTPQKKMFMCASEVVKTESNHVKQLCLLIDRYLEPMKLEVYLPRNKMTTIYNNILTVMIQQKQFLGRIEDLPNNESEDTKKLVKELSEAFMIHLDTFKQYSQFCAAQHELENIFLNIQDHQKLKEFLEARNPKQDPSLTLQFLLTKPVLRLIQYPLYLNALKDTTEKGSEEYNQITETLTSLTAVTEHINEVKRVTEIYANVFDSLLEGSGLSEFGISVRVSELLHHVTVMWLNPSSGALSRGWKKGQGPKIHFFVFSSNVTLLHVVEQTAKKSKASLTQGSVTVKDIIHSALFPLAQCKVNDLPDSDGVSSMWQIVHKGRELNSQAVTYILRSKSLKEKTVVVEILQQAIQAQLALYTNISGSLSPTKTICSESSVSHDHHVTASVRLGLLKARNPEFNESLDSEYELTLL